MSNNNTKHINELYATGTTKVSEWKQAKRLRDMIKDGSVLDKAEREILLGILDHNNKKHITELYTTGTTKASEFIQAKRLRDMIEGEWDIVEQHHGTAVPGLDKAERELLLGILDQWIEILEDEGGGEA